jgi:pentatricopeptide repeat protein
LQICKSPVVTWTAIIQAYAIHGNATEALKLFDTMQKQNIQPSDIMFVSLLNACSHSGLVEQAWELFSTMKTKFGIEPTVEHYGCIVDAYARFCTYLLLYVN